MNIQTAIAAFCLTLIASSACHADATGFGLLGDTFAVFEQFPSLNFTSASASTSQNTAFEMSLATTITEAQANPAKIDPSPAKDWIFGGNPGLSSFQFSIVGAAGTNFTGLEVYINHNGNFQTFEAELNGAIAVGEYVGGSADINGFQSGVVRYFWPLTFTAGEPISISLHAPNVTNINVDRIQVNVVPEPAIYAAFCAGLVLIGRRKFRRKGPR